MTPRAVRHPDEDALVDHAASRLLSVLTQLQEVQETVHLCLGGGELSSRVLDRFAGLVPDSGLRPESLHLWWSDERFVPTTDVDRNALRSLSILGRTLRLAGSQTHPMPSSEGHADPDEAAFAYAAELGETVFDLCLLDVGDDGHVAALFGQHESFEPTTSLAIGVTDAPVGPAGQTSLTLAAINRSRRVWLWAAGPSAAGAVAAGLSGVADVPAAHVRGTDETLWFVDDQAAALLPRHHCQL